jgi:hypothetical protein
MTPVTHFVVNGDSFTYCEGLEDRTNKGWPWLLAKHFKLPVVNLAVPGTGNDTIHRRTYEYYYLNQEYGNNPFFIIGWSQFWRREAWLNSKKNYQFIGIPNRHKKFKNIYQLPYLENHNDEDHVRRTLIYKSSLINLFHSFNVPYLMSDYSSDTDLIAISKEKIKNLDKKIKNLENYCYNNNHVSAFCKITKHFSKTECGHDGIEGNFELSKFLIKTIKTKYSNINPTYGKKFLEFEEFNDITEK